MTETTTELRDSPRPLRQILAGPGCLTASSLFDPISARIAHSLGFEVGVIGGSVASCAVLGAPDLILLTMTELVEQARRVPRGAAAGDRRRGPRLRQCPERDANGLQELQAAGVAGITIEDTLLPRAFGSPATPQLVSLEEGVGEMKAAIAGRARPATFFGLWPHQCRVDQRCRRRDPATQGLRVGGCRCPVRAGAENAGGPGPDRRSGPSTAHPGRWQRGDRRPAVPCQPGGAHLALGSPSHSLPRSRVSTMR